MNKRLISSIAIVAIVLLAFLLRMISTVFFDVLIVGVMIIASAEMARGLGNKFSAPVLPVVVAFPVVSYAIFALLQNLGYVFLLVLAVFVVMLGLMFVIKKLEFANVLSTVFVMIYPTCLLAFLLPINEISTSWFSLTPLVLVFAVSSLSDTMAYLVGSRLRGPKLAPSISPNKTISGAIGGLLGGVIGALLVMALGYFEILGFRALDTTLGFNVMNFVILGVVGSVVTQIGDLIASVLKRTLDIKDYGAILPGHGGIMDRVDGLMLNAMFVYLYFFVLMQISLIGG